MLSSDQSPCFAPHAGRGFLLSLVGETDRRAHIGARVTAGLLNHPDLSVVLRTVWRVKSKPLGSSGNTRPDYQQLLSNIQLVVWLDSTDESATGTLEERVRNVVVHKRFSEVRRFGGLSLGESTHLVDEVSPLLDSEAANARCFLLNNKGRMTLPVWVDHVGSAGTTFAVGNLEIQSNRPDIHQIPKIAPVVA